MAQNRTSCDARGTILRIRQTPQKTQFSFALPAGAPSLEPNVNLEPVRAWLQMSIWVYGDNANHLPIKLMIAAEM
jgi:hypothetical protein